MKVKTGMPNKIKIALALGGGGARGLAHVGVLKVLERERIIFDLIVGTSMGALVGAAYAIEPDAAVLERRVLDFFRPEENQSRRMKLLEKLNSRATEKADLLHRLMRIAEKELALTLILARKSLLSEKDLRRIFKTLLPEIDLKDTKIPFSAIAVDLISGREVVLKSGQLIPAVMASCAVPGFMPPVSWEGMLLIDGGILDPVPCRIAKQEGAEIVIGVDVGHCICRPRPVEDGLDEIQRSIDIMSFHINKQSKECANVVIEPDVKGVEWTDFSKYKELIQKGEEAAEREMNKIRKILPWGFPKRLFQRVNGVIGGFGKICLAGKFSKPRGKAAISAISGGVETGS